MELNKKKCIPCEGGIPKLTREQVDIYFKELNNDWEVIDDNKIKRIFHFVNFVQTMDFVNRLAEIAEEEGHHPDLHISYGKCLVELWTHAINGLSENDFIVAAKIDKL
jgi:4a-hydroxytetrahydrobiopterin dehydratase